MLDNEEYEDWFGIPLKEIEEMNKLQEKKKEINPENKNNQDLSHKKGIKKEKKNKVHLISLKNLINKKRKPEKENFLKEQNKKEENNINIEQKDKNNVENNENYFNNELQINNIHNQYNNNDENENNFKTISLFTIRKKEGIVRFNGIKNKFEPNEKILKHIIYLKTYNDFNSEIKNKKFTWTVNILCDSKFIGVGLADKYVVTQNNFKFFSKKKSFYNGVFCLYSMFDKTINKYKVYAWHPGNISLNDKEIDFPAFEKGITITLVYDTNTLSLEFITSKGEINSTYKMNEVKALGDIGRNILTPSIIFFYPNDQVKISKLELVAKK